MMLVKQFHDVDRWRHVLRISRLFFQVESQRSSFIFHYVRRETVKNADGKDVNYWVCDCSGFKFMGYCWHVSECELVYNRDPEYKHDLLKHKIKEDQDDEYSY